MAGRPKSSSKGAPRKPVMRLFWCSTPDHDEDWFIVAATARSAGQQHEIDEGYAPGTARAENRVRCSNT